eukprot:TRINITY_DN19239_c0_g1_i2.p1 TRINITY_DN19239_c0_g1~~TRINITY_DN19239_c0_g1_i2.p1  ORF type:complete len:521 (+),score=156.36 TRINITY_DN19239_c0_g1_i2:56-1564(+)
MGYQRFITWRNTVEFANSPPAESDPDIRDGAKVCAAGGGELRLFGDTLLASVLAGRGTFSDVLSCKVVGTEEEVAVKVYRSGGNEDKIHRRELKRLKAIQLADPAGKQALSRMLGSFDQERVPDEAGADATVHSCIVFQLHGPSLFTLLRSCDGRVGVALPDPHMACVADQLLGAVAFLHDEVQIVHRDIKPENILLKSPHDGPHGRRPGAPYSFKFGAPGSWSVVLSDLGSSTSELTDMYKSPEVILRTHPVGVEYDVWCLGLTLLELSTGLSLVEGVVHDQPVLHLRTLERQLGVKIPDSMLQMSQRTDLTAPIIAAPERAEPCQPCLVDLLFYRPPGPERLPLCRSDSLRALLVPMLEVCPSDRVAASAALMLHRELCHRKHRAAAQKRSRGATLGPAFADASAARRRRLDAVPPPTPGTVHILLSEPGLAASGLRFDADDAGVVLRECGGACSLHEWIGKRLRSVQRTPVRCTDDLPALFSSAKPICGSYALELRFDP